MDGKSYRLFPGNYPGGISTSKATLYLDPGIYFIGGRDPHPEHRCHGQQGSGDNTGMTLSGGVLIFNTTIPSRRRAAQAPGCYGPITINGGGGDTLTRASPDRERRL